MEKFNCVTAQKVPLEQILAYLNIAVQKKKGDNIWYLSPFKQEKTASFKVNTSINKWYDFSIGMGGDSIRFLELYQKCNTSGALDFLKSIKADFFSFQKPLEQPTPSPIEILHIGDIQQEELIVYLQSRGIYTNEALSYVREITYFNVGRVYQSIGFPNQSGGYELRGERFKSCYGKKDVSFIDKGGKNLAVFEGFMDFLSYLILEEYDKTDYNYLILNSVAMVSRIETLILRHKEIHLFLDNDLSGKAATEGLLAQFPQLQNRASSYTAHKDLNDYLMYKFLEEGHE